MPILRDLHQQRANNLASNGHDQAKAKVSARDWAAALAQGGIPLETMETLRAAGRVKTDGTYIALE